ncbi:MAG: STAS domain-containing protein [Gemmataceae bacterium]
MPATAAPPPFTMSETGSRLLIRFDGVSELDSANSDSIGLALQSAVESNPRPDVRVDLSNIHFLASMALSLLLRLDQVVRAFGGRLTLANIRPDVRKVFTVTRLDQVLAIDSPAAGG